MTTETALDNITQIHEDRAERQKLAIEGLDINEATFEDDGHEIEMECEVLGMTVVARIEYDKEWDKGTRESGIDPHWEIDVGEFKELYIDFGRGHVGKDIPHDCGLALAILEAAQEWIDGHYENQPAPSAED